MNGRITRPHDDLTQAIIGAAFEVANQLGHGYLEAVYRKALSHELTLRGLPIRQEVPFTVTYKGLTVGHYVADLLVDDAVVVELKAVEGLNRQHIGQVLNYLKASGAGIGLLLNFGKPRLEFKRVLR